MTAATLRPDSRVWVTVPAEADGAWADRTAAELLESQQDVDPEISDSLVELLVGVASLAGHPTWRMLLVPDLNAGALVVDIEMIALDRPTSELATVQPLGGAVTVDDVSLGDFVGQRGMLLRLEQPEQGGEGQQNSFRNPERGHTDQVAPTIGDVGVSGSAPIRADLSYALHSRSSATGLLLTTSSYDLALIVEATEWCDALIATITMPTPEGVITPV